MKYILNPAVALRSWKYVSHAFYINGIRNAQGLKREEFELLSRCDGIDELSDTPLLNSLLERGLCRPAQNGARLTPWQRPLVCKNRYFPAMNWAITGKCNYNCLHCFNAADNARLNVEFNWDECVRLMDQARDCGINAFTITGGEPMLHPHFLDIVRGIHERGMFLEELNTNGYFITQEILDEMKRIGCNPLMKISFDGVGHHDWLRGHKGAEAEALRAIKLCIANGFKVKVQTNVHKLNLDTMLPTAELMNSLGVNEMRIIRTTETPRWNENSAHCCEGGACLGLDEYYDAMLDFTRSYLTEPHNMNIDIWQFLSFWPNMRSYHYRPVEGGCHSYRDSLPVCRGNRGLVGVNSDGQLVPCLQLSGTYAKRGENLGNVKTDDLCDILTGSIYLSEVCTSVGDLRHVNEKCNACPYFKLCLGGCRAIAVALTGDKLGCDPAKCLYFNGGYMQKTKAIFDDFGYRNTDDISE